MDTRTRDAWSAEHGLRSLERLISEGEAMAAEVALDLVAAGVEALGDEEQRERLEAAREALGELKRVGGPKFH